jgi:hypothetical protein
MIAVAGWEIELEALPKGKPGLNPNDPLIGIGPAKGGFVDDTGRARRAIKRKASHYDGLDAPLVVAVMPLGGFFDFEDAVGALYGSEVVTFSRDDPQGTARVTRRPDGVWSSGAGEVSAVLFGDRILPWTVGQVWPELWVNPVAARSLAEDFGGAPRVEVGENGELQRLPSTAETPAALFGLDPDWPGVDAWSAT